MILFLTNVNRKLFYIFYSGERIGYAVGRSCSAVKIKKEDDSGMLFAGDVVSLFFHIPWMAFNFTDWLSISMLHTLITL